VTNKKSPPAATGRPRSSHQLAASDFHEANTTSISPRDWRETYLSRRYRIHPSLARAVVSLILKEAMQ
jgi:hypothetical protein